MHELKLYLDKPRIDRNDCPLMWWSDNDKEFPILSKISKKYLTGQSSSVVAERIFSMASNMLTKKLSKLYPEKLDLLIFIYQN